MAGIHERVDGLSVNIGKLDNLVILESLSTTNTSGSVTNSYSTVATLWAHIISERGQEALQSARVNYREKIRVCIRYREDVTAKHRLTWEGRAYNILAIDRTDRRKGFLWLTCEAVSIT